MEKEQTQALSTELIQAIKQLEVFNEKLKETNMLIDQLASRGIYLSSDENQKPKIDWY